MAVATRARMVVATRTNYCGYMCKDGCGYTPTWLWLLPRGYMHMAVLAHDSTYSQAHTRAFEYFVY